MSGWGSSGWGEGPWGSGDELRLARVEPVRENVLRIEFTEAPYFSGILDPHDASNPSRYNITPDSSSTSGDGKPPRSVTPVLVEVFGGAGSIIDITVDRPFSPYPGNYFLAVNGLVSSLTGALLAADGSAFQFRGLYRFVPPPRRDLAIPSRDIANPQTLNALLDPLPVTTDPLILGSIPVGDGGDYAFDEGVTNLKKRVYRRLLTRKGGFAALPDYGVGVPDQLKRLGIAAVRSQLAAEAQKQLASEPDVEAVSVKVVNDADAPGLVRFKVRVRAKFTESFIDIDVPFSPTG